MRCTSPIAVGGRNPNKITASRNADDRKELSFPCGQCLACRINKRREWTSRLQLEYGSSSTAVFVTLTYSDEHLPQGGLQKKAVQKWLKRLRYFLPDCGLRYFVVGEYGDETFRPHYHALLFNLPLQGSHEVIEKSWPFGNIHLGDVTPESISYVAGYTVKKMTRKDDMRLNGLNPEFALQSRKPAIGYYSLQKIASTLNNAQAQYIAAFVGMKSVILGRTLKTKLAELLIGKSLDDFNIAESMRSAEFLKENQKNYAEWLLSSGTQSYNAFLAYQARQRRKNLEKKEKIFSFKKQRWL